MATPSSSNEDQPWDVIIIGAGLAGLTAAYRILKTDSNAKVLVLEAKGLLKVFYTVNLIDFKTLKEPTPFFSDFFKLFRYQKKGHTFFFHNSFEILLLKYVPSERYWCTCD